MGDYRAKNKIYSSEGSLTVRRLLGTGWVVLVFTGALQADRSEMPSRVGPFPQEKRTFYTTQQGFPSNDVRSVAVEKDGAVYVHTAKGDFTLRNGEWVPSNDAAAILRRKHQVPSDIGELPKQAGKVLAVAHAPEGKVAIGTEWALLLTGPGGTQAVFPQEGNRRWAPSNVFVDYDGLERLWFGSAQGAGCYQDGKWRLYSGVDGLPYDDITSVAGGGNGTVWFGTKRGVIRFDGKAWAYRQGKRWLPGDEVRDVALDAEGNAWVATDGGLSFIYFVAMTLAEKARFYEDQIDQVHRRTRFGYVIEAQTEVAGEKVNIRLDASDNDGLWTSMYGAGECFAYGATQDPMAKRRASDVLEALQLLSQAPRGAEYAPPQGFIARTVLEVASNRDPNKHAYSLEQQMRTQQRDRYWRVYQPRWPKSADGKYYWKSDTSSDELDGHYFFYALYYDLVAEDEQQKSVVRELVRDNIDHLIKHDFSLHDHAGRTRWAVYGPRELNQNPEWHVERGLNSISMLSYLNVAYHITGDVKYREVGRQLREKHSYHINALTPKYQRGIGSGNHSDDEMAFMAFYNLIKYEPDPELKKLYLVPFANSWRQEEPEMNPFFNFCYAAVGAKVKVSNIYGEHDLSPWPNWLDDSIDTLKRFPLDRFDWRHTNHHRKDLLLLSKHWADAYQEEVRGKGYRNNGKVIPVDERYFNHWNSDPWELDTGGGGRVIGTGTVFTLPYYMGLYHGFIAVD
ncbi:MAG: hypothetical protein P8N76_11750 [Pirellulaceae bacterium]|nr:hypothetical protein [Pirellulaceae bacterium]